MSAHDILFSVRAVGNLYRWRTKTQTRRPLRLPPQAEYDGTGRDDEGRVLVACSRSNQPTGSQIVHCPYGDAGKRLYVKETWAPRLADDGSDDPNRRYVKYKADDPKADSPSDPMDWHTWPGAWRSARDMPRWAMRIVIEIVRVRVERLQDISEADAKAEGMPCDSGLAWECDTSMGDPYEAAVRRGHRAAFREHWDKTHGRRETWEKNPRVWVLDFRLDEVATKALEA